MEPSVDFRRRNYRRNVLLGNVCKEMENSRLALSQQRNELTIDGISKNGIVTVEICRGKNFIFPNTITLHNGQLLLIHP